MAVYACVGVCVSWALRNPVHLGGTIVKQGTSWKTSLSLSLHFLTFFFSSAGARASLPVLSPSRATLEISTSPSRE